MSEIVQCDCGAKIRLPEQAGQRALRCPKCKTGIALSADVKVLSSRTAAAGESDATCPICQSLIAASEDVVQCPSCEQVHHRECWAEIGGCGTYGCNEAPHLEKGSDDGPPLSAWGDTKQCPACGESIKAIALKCRYCQTEFDTVDPLSLADLSRQVRRRDDEKGLRSSVIALFVFSLIVCFAPITLIIGLVFFFSKRQRIAKLGPVFTVMTCSAIVLSLVYSGLILIFVMIEAV